ncbi:MAG: hypothetical protein WA162_00320 [Thermodesulfobacteriota bacterium]
MSIGKRVSEALLKLDQTDYEGALIPICISVAATSTKEYPTLIKDNEKYKAFLRDNVDIITLAGIGIIIKGGVVFKFSDTSIKHPTVAGQATWDELLYHAVRCNLIHEAGLGSKIIFKEGNTIGLLDNAILLPAELLQGMIFAVIGSISNVNERLVKKYTCTFGKQIGDLDTLWGDKAKIMSLLTQAGPKSQ